MTPSTPVVGVGVVSGSIEVPTGRVLPASLTVTLHGFDHGQMPAADRRKCSLSPARLRPTAPIVRRRGDAAQSHLSGRRGVCGHQVPVQLQVGGGQRSTAVLPPLNVYEPSTDVSLLELNQVHVYTDFATAGTVQVLEIFAFTNNSDNAVIISTDGVTIPFIPLPAGAVNQGYEAGQDSASFVAADDGLAVVPSDRPYSIIAFFNLPYDESLDFPALPIERTRFCCWCLTASRFGEQFGC